MDKEEVQKLSELARISISDTEAESLSHEFEAILGYVGEVKKIQQTLSESKGGVPAVRNVMRDDTHPHEAGLYTEAILREAPAREDGYIKVKKILS